MAGEKNCEVEALEQRCAQLENDMQKMQERLAWMDMTLNDTGKYIIRNRKLHGRRKEL